MGVREKMSVREEGRERVESILIQLIHPSAVLPTGIFACTHSTHALSCSQHWSDVMQFVIQLRVYGLDIRLAI